MSLVMVRMADIVKRQYLYKLKSFKNEFMSLLLLQILAIVFSFNGTGMMGTGSSSFEFRVYYYSADIVVIFTMIWILSTAIRITTKAYRNEDFTFVANRVTSGLANILYLLTASLIGGVTSMLSTYLLKDIMYFFKGMPLFSSAHVISAPAEFLLGTFAITLYMFLFGSLGYLTGTLVQFYKGFIVLLPAFVIGILILWNTQVTSFVYHFLFTESSFFIFFAKVTIIAAVCFTFALSLSNRMEVKL